MITLLLNALIAILFGVVLTCTDVSPWYWSILWGLLLFVGGQFLLGLLLRRKMTKVSDRMQAIMQAAQAKMQAKVQRWRTQQMSNAKAAEAELAKDRDAMIAEIQAVLHPLERYRLWIPLLGRQLATMELQFAWQKKDYKRFDELLPRALLMDPLLVCMKLARMWQQEADLAAIEKVFRKATRRARYGTTALLYGTYSWMLVKRGKVDEAYKVLTEAQEKNEHATLKANLALLANNKIAHFSNAGFGDEWLALQLEEPKVKAQRHRPNGRYFL